jgi:hypothetical protein
VALRYGPLIYNVERADQNELNLALGDTPLKAEWQNNLLGGVVVLKGTWADGKPLLAIPNFARMNRIGQVPPGEPGAGNVNYAPGSTGGSAAAATESRPRRRADGPESIVWLTAP